MFDSDFNANSILPIHQSIHNAFDDQYSHDNDHNLLNPFHSHLLDDDDLFLQGTMLPYNSSPPQLAPLPPAATNKELIGEKIGEKKAVRKGGGSKSRKTGKKDRHSKIHTAQGPRDRRMRLSLQIARKFFDLQDLLGFDKASKTIEWLFNKSKAAIKDLADKRSCNSLISSSPRENIMEIDTNVEDNECEKMKKKEGKNNKRIICEKRKEARARARERTQEKLKMQKQGKRKTLIMNKEGLEIMDENPSTSLEKERALEDQMASVGIIEKFLAGSSLMANFGDDYDDAFSMGFPENEFQEIGRINSDGDYGILSNNMEIVNSDYTYQVQEGPNCSFMGRTFNQGY